MPAAQIGELAAAEGVVLHELTPQAGTLEESFMELTADSLEYGQHGGPPAVTGQPDPGQPDRGQAAAGQAAGPLAGGEGR